MRTSAPATLFPGEDSNDQGMGYQLGVLVTCAAVFGYVFLRRGRKLPAIRDVPGPVNPSWIFGMFPVVNLALLPPPGGFRH